MTSFARAYNAVTRRGRIERFCEQLGWDIDGRDGDVLTLNFNCPLIGTRPVYVSSGDEPLVLFWSASMTVFEQHRAPDYVIGYALFDNAFTKLGKWQASFNKQNDVYPAREFACVKKEWGDADGEFYDIILAGLKELSDGSGDHQPAGANRSGPGDIPGDACRTA